MIRGAILCIFLFTCHINAQLGKDITTALLEQQFYAADSSAPAAYIFKKSKTWFEIKNFRWYVITEESHRIKIYKSAGLIYGNLRVPCILIETIPGFTFVDGITYNLQDGKIKQNVADSTNIFTEKKGKYLAVKKIFLPDVREGSVIDVTYRTAVPYISTIRDWHFQGAIPSLQSEYEILIPEFFSYNRYLGGFLEINESTPKWIKGNKTFSENRLFYSVSNVPALKEEAYVNNINNYLSSIRFELAKANYQKGENVNSYAMNWQTVGTAIYNDEDFGKQLEGSGFFKKIVADILSPQMSHEQKAHAVFSYVQEHMNWNKVEDYSCRYGLKEAYRTRVGNTADINLMLVAMLREAGLDAGPVLLSTRDNGLILYPNISTFNYVIAVAKIGGKSVLFDATSKFTSPGILPINTLNWSGREIVSVGQSKERIFFAKETMISASMVSKRTNSVLAVLLPNGEVKGKTRTQDDNYFALLDNEYMSGLQDDIIADLYVKTFGITDIKNFKSTKGSSEKPVTLQYDFVDNKSCTVTANRIYFSPMLYLAEEENPFKLNERKYPVDFIFPFRKSTQVTLEIPEGYTIEHLPLSEKVSFTNGLGEYSYSISNEGAKLQLMFTYIFNTAIITPEHYNELKTYYSNLIRKQNEQIILVKK